MLLGFIERLLGQSTLPFLLAEVSFLEALGFQGIYRDYMCIYIQVYT